MTYPVVAPDDFGRPLILIPLPSGIEWWRESKSVAEVEEGGG